MYDTTAEALAAAFQAITDLELEIQRPRIWDGPLAAGALEAAFLDTVYADGLDEDGGVTWALTHGDDRRWTIHIDRMVANPPFYTGFHEPEWELPSHSAVITLREPGRPFRDFTFVVADAQPSSNAGSVDKTIECRQWARGMYTTKAAVELLARGPQPRMLHSSRPWVITSSTGNTTYVDAKRLLEGTGGWSGGETLVVDVALSLLDGEPFKLSDISRLDTGNTRLVLAAVAHASGIYAGTQNREPAAEFDAILSRL